MKVFSFLLSFLVLFPSFLLARVWEQAGINFDVVKLGCIAEMLERVHIEVITYLVEEGLTLLLDVVDHFCYWAARHAGSAIVAMGGVDAVAFTGGIGENAAPIRDAIMGHLSCFGDVPVHVIAADEEKAIARDALQVMNA